MSQRGLLEGVILRCYTVLGVLTCPLRVGRSVGLELRHSPQDPGPAFALGRWHARDRRDGNLHQDQTESVRGADKGGLLFLSAGEIPTLVFSAFKRILGAKLF